MIGRAKSAIEKCGYIGDSYYKALEELESRTDNPSLFENANWTGPGKQLEYKMTSLKKPRTSLKLCRPLSGHLRYVDMNVICKWKLTFPSLLTSCLKSLKQNGRITPNQTVFLRPSLVEFRYLR